MILTIINILLIIIAICAIFLVMNTIKGYFDSLEDCIKMQSSIIRDSVCPSINFNTVLTDAFLDLHANDEIILKMCNGDVYRVTRKFWEIVDGQFVSKPALYDENGHNFRRNTVIDIASISSYEISHRVISVSLEASDRATSISSEV